MPGAKALMAIFRLSANSSNCVLVPSAGLTKVVPVDAEVLGDANDGEDVAEFSDEDFGGGLLERDAV